MTDSTSPRGPKMVMTPELRASLDRLAELLSAATKAQMAAAAAVAPVAEQVRMIVQTMQPTLAAIAAQQAEITMALAPTLDAIARVQATTRVQVAPIVPALKELNATAARIAERLDTDAVRQAISAINEMDEADFAELIADLPDASADLDEGDVDQQTFEDRDTETLLLEWAAVRRALGLVIGAIVVAKYMQLQLEDPELLASLESLYTALSLGFLIYKVVARGRKD